MISPRRTGGLAFLAWVRLVRLVMADSATCRCAKFAMTGHVPSDSADDRAFDTSLRLDLNRRDCGDDNEGCENSRLKSHLQNGSGAKIFCVEKG